MSDQRRPTHPKDHLASADVDGFDSLTELALDMRSSWNHSTDQVWRLLDPVLWDITHNPWVILQTVSRAKLQSMLAEPAFRKTVDDLVQARREDAEAPAWFQQTHADSPLSCVAYFSMEFMLSEAFADTRADLATSPVTSSRPRAIWACRLSASDCSISRAISVR